MVNYQNGKIYEIVCRKTDERYIGSTTQPLSSRLNDHRKNKRKTSSSTIIERGDYFINLLENYSCNNLEQLLKKEREWYDKIICINKYKPYVSKKERLEQYKVSSNKNYNLNKNIINEKKKEKMICKCGVEHRIADKQRHLKSQKHLKKSIDVATTNYIKNT